MTPDALARLQAPLHHLIPHSLLLVFRQLGQRRILADLVEFTVVDGRCHGGFVCRAGVAYAASQRFESVRASMSMNYLGSIYNLWQRISAVQQQARYKSKHVPVP